MSFQLPVTITIHLCILTVNIETEMILILLLQTILNTNTSLVNKSLYNERYLQKQNKKYIFYMFNLFLVTSTSLLHKCEEITLDNPEKDQCII